MLNPLKIDKLNTNPTKFNKTTLNAKINAPIKDNS